MAAKWLSIATSLHVVKKLLPVCVLVMLCSQGVCAEKTAPGMKKTTLLEGDAARVFFQLNRTPSLSHKISRKEHG